MSQQPAADSRFENPFIITQFLSFISFKCRQQLLEWTTPEQMANEINNLAGFEAFSELINDPFFAKKWNVLYEKCSNKEPPNMREAVNYISTYLNETGSAIKNFNYFPDPPKSAIQFYVTEKNMNDEPVLDMQFEGDEKYKQMEFDDLKRYYEELRTLQAAERRRHSRVQCLYLNNRISATKAKLQLQEAENSQVDQRISPLPNGQIETVTIAMPSTQSITLPKTSHNKLMAIDFFCILHPELEKMEACKQFSCLSRDGRAIFDKLEEVQDVIYTRMTPMDKQRDQQNFSVGDKRLRVD
uniref:RGS domain-containing protein n=1 Tax=Panagrellus redivivus TaxID=6233 RepID=A0A7E4W3Y7_PANRE